jgi:hypothetical protein
LFKRVRPFKNKCRSVFLLLAHKNSLGKGWSNNSLLIEWEDFRVRNVPELKNFNDLFFRM